MVHLRQEMRGKPESERNFLAGETERVFAITNWDTRISFITGFEMLAPEYKRIDIDTMDTYT